MMIHEHIGPDLYHCLHSFCYPLLFEKYKHPLLKSFIS